MFSINHSPDISKNPVQEGPALVHLAEVIWVTSFAGSVQVSGVRNPLIEELRI